MPAPVGGPTPSPDQTSTTDSPAGSEETPAPANDRSLSTPSPVVEGMYLLHARHDDGDDGGRVDLKAMVSKATTLVVFNSST